MIEDRYPARSKVDETFDGAKSRWGFTAIEVAGHTEGSVLLLHEATGALFSGDAILAGFPVQRFRVRLKLAVPEYSLDADACHRAVRAFLRDEPDVRILCAGHGPILREDVPRRLATLV
jgi:glyoxylase-like metal-dependent hydrolase (beta-lactamase superfamily II)